MTHALPTSTLFPYTTLFRSLFVNVFSHIETNSHITGSFKRLTFSINRPQRSEERFSRNAETDFVCRLLLEKKNSGRPSRLLYWNCKQQCRTGVPQWRRSYRQKYSWA